MNFILRKFLSILRLSNIIIAHSVCSDLTFSSEHKSQLIRFARVCYNVDDFNN